MTHTEDGLSRSARGTITVSGSSNLGILPPQTPGLSCLHWTLLPWLDSGNAGSVRHQLVFRERGPAGFLCPLPPSSPDSLGDQDGGKVLSSRPSAIPASPSRCSGGFRIRPGLEWRGLGWPRTMGLSRSRAYPSHVPDESTERPRTIQDKPCSARQWRNGRRLRLRCGARRRSAGRVAVAAHVPPLRPTPQSSATQTTPPSKVHERETDRGRGD